MDSPAKPKSRCAFICCRVLLLLFVVMAVSGVFMYYRFFKRAPVADIMARNRATLFKATVAVDDYEYYEDMSSAGDSVFENLTPQISKLLWSKFIQDNKFVSIGDVYDKCGKFAW